MSTESRFFWRPGEIKTNRKTNTFSFGFSFGTFSKFILLIFSRFRSNRSLFLAINVLFLMKTKLKIGKIDYYFRIENLFDFILVS